MFKFNRVVSLCLLLIIGNSFPVNMSFSSTYIPQGLGNIRVCHGDDGFFIEKDGDQIPVNSYDIDPILRNTDNKKLSILMHAGYISVSKIGNDYALKYNARVRGGGPGGAVLCATLTKGAVDAAAEGIYVGVGWLASWIATPAGGMYAYHVTKTACMVPQKLIGNTLSLGAGIWGGTWLPF